MRKGADGQGEEKAQGGPRNQARFLGTKEYRKRKDVYCGLSGLFSFVGSPVEHSRAGERHDRENPEGSALQDVAPVGSWPDLVTHPDLTARNTGKCRKSWIIGESQVFLPQAPT